LLGRVLVCAVVVLAAAAAADAFRPSGGEGDIADERGPLTERRGPMLAFGAGDFVPAGRRLNDRVLRGDAEYLSAEAIADAFPAPVGGPIDVAKVAATREGTLALGIYRFPSAQPTQGAVEVWANGRLVGAFTVPAGYFGGGLALTPDGRRIATFGHDGTLRGVFDRQGRRLSGLDAGAE
jgi:hypothetical protein